MRRSNVFLVAIFIGISSITFFLAQNYKETKVEEYQGKYLEPISKIVGTGIANDFAWN